MKNRTTKTKQPYERPSEELLKKHREFADIIITDYGQKICQLVENGWIDFDPDELKEVVRGEKLSYDDYIDAQINALGKTHSGFQQCFYTCSHAFKGRVEKTSKQYICFQKIYIEGMYSDGLCFENKEQHVWMDLEGFEKLKSGDCVSFFAEPYRYLKTGNGKQIDFGLRNPKCVTKIRPYDLPSDEQLVEQALDMMLCDNCFLYDHCDKIICINAAQIKETKKSMWSLLKPDKK